MEKMEMKKYTHGLSFDVEDWYQSCVNGKAPITKRAYHNTLAILDLLEKHQVRATMFVQGMVAETFPQLVRKMQKEGHEIATHGYSHQSVRKLGPKRFQKELTLSIRILEDITGEKVLGHRAPDFSIGPDTPWAFEIMAKAGLQYDSSIYPIQGRRYGDPQAPIEPYWVYKNGTSQLLELPLAVILLGTKRFPIAGGGYIRHYPLWFIHWAFGKLAQERRQAIFYFHPYEINHRETMELCRNKPDLSWKMRFFMFRQGLLRETMPKKLSSILKKYTFLPLGELVHSWSFSGVK
ncbi:MAG: DUF3473 domain-containing protein [Planctomycetota bacterium]|nr:MAG: DUF3473 domain-containing protein [Planctomycetota bacterium]